MYENLAFNNKLEYKSVISEPIGTNSNNQYGHIKVSIGNLEKQLKVQLFDRTKKQIELKE